MAGDGNSVPSFLLRSISRDNTQNPTQALEATYVDGHPDFERFGWKDLNYSPSLSASGTYETIDDCVGTAFNAHETDPALHKYGKLSEDPQSDDYVFEKLAKFDVSNVKEGRGQVFFPFQTGHFTTETVLNGIYRIWDNGFLEMDVVFRLGKSASDPSSSIISANNRSFQYSPTLNQRLTSYN